MGQPKPKKKDLRIPKRVRKIRTSLQERKGPAGAGAAPADTAVQGTPVPGIPVGGRRPSEGTPPADNLKKSSPTQHIGIRLNKQTKQKKRKKVGEEEDKETLGRRDADGRVLLVVVVHWCRWRVRKRLILSLCWKEAETAMAVRVEACSITYVYVYKSSRERRKKAVAGTS